MLCNRSLVVLVKQCKLIKRKQKIVDSSAGTKVENMKLSSLLISVSGYLIFTYKPISFTFINYGDIANICVDQVVKKYAYTKVIINS